MNIFKRMIKAISPETDYALISSVNNGFYINFNNTNNILNPQALENCYKGIVATCIDLKAKYASTAKVVIKRKINQTENEELNKHPFVNILEMPNKFISGHNLLLNTYQHLEIYGNAYYYIPKGTMGLPTSYLNNGGITPLHPKYVKIIYNNLGLPSSYEYTVSGQKSINYSIDEIIHIKYNNPFNLFEGMSTVQKAYTQILIDSELTNYQSMALKNGGLKKQAIKAKQKLTKEQIEFLQQQYNETHSGSFGSNKVMILSGDMDMINLGLSTQDLDYIESKKYFKNEIMNIFGVHIGIMEAENVNKANSESAIVLFNHMCIKTMLSALASALTLYIRQVYNKDLFIEFQLETPELPEYKLQQYKLGLEQGAIKKNEYREWMDYDAIEELDITPVKVINESNANQSNTNDTNDDNTNTQSNE